MLKLITQRNPKSPVSEAFRTLRTNIQFSNIDKNITTIVVTSAGPNEGKSTVAANLAYTIGQEDRKVLLIDCDMRKPTVHKAFRITNLFGLTNILMEEKSIDDVVYTGKDEFGGLYVLTSGPIPPNPAELLNSTKMERFLKEARAEYDMIILDAPPVGIVTDAAILSTIADGVILVAASGEANIDETKRGKELLDKVNAHIIGAVLNKIPMEDMSQYRYGYYAYGEENLDEREKRPGKREKGRRSK